MEVHPAEVGQESEIVLIFGMFQFKALPLQGDLK
jgi:hypothetical protein